ncbi:MAG: hypothetical protein PHH98_05030 [Candidatus Gracilibacteria bacterium]|nr:hypothetical protein [Candidatus Gracilibacteria bacterium]
MLENFIKNYYKLLDEKIENGTIMVLIIALLIITIGNIINSSEKSDFLGIKSNILEADNNNQLIIINGKKYILGE